MQWLWQLDQNIDIHAENEDAFKQACKRNFVEIAQWLCTLCNDYHIVIDNSKIKKYLVKDKNQVVLELIENNKYNDAITKLNIKSVSAENINECMVCQDEPSEIIKLPCRHTLCLYAIVKFNVINKKTINRCFYCRKEYQWSQCVAIATSLRSAH